MKASPVRTGVIFGLFLAFFHAAWAGLVAAGLAQKVIDFIFWAHFIAPPYQIEPGEVTRAAILVGITFLAGLTFGVIGGSFWNMSRRAGCEDESMDDATSGNGLSSSEAAARLKTFGPNELPNPDRRNFAR